MSSQRYPSRLESRAGFFASTRDECLSPRVRLECNPEIPVAPLPGPAAGAGALHAAPRGAGKILLPVPVADLPGCRAGQRTVGGLHPPARLHPAAGLHPAGDAQATHHPRSRSRLMRLACLEQVTIVCVTYQSESIIESLAATLRVFPHVVIVDNGSHDATTARIRRHIPHARLVERPRNAGFGAANNEAMMQVCTPFALLLNPDSSIEPADLATLVDTLDGHPGAAAVAPQSWYHNGEPQRSFRQAFYKIRGRKGRYEPAQATCCADWLHGSCVLLRTDLFRRIGGFDESFFLYYEDDDLCLRL